MGHHAQHSSAATRVFRTPEVLQVILSHMSVVDFFYAQVGHQQFMDVALLYPKLRYQFFLEADPRPCERPVVNPLFEKAIGAGGWEYENPEALTKHECVKVRCKQIGRLKHIPWQPEPFPTIPPQMIVCQPPTAAFDLNLKINPRYHWKLRKWGAPQELGWFRYDRDQQNLQKKIDNVLVRRQGPDPEAIAQVSTLIG